MIVPNMHFLYNISYFDELQNAKALSAIKDIDFTTKNNELINFKFDESNKYLETLTKELSACGGCSFELVTMYPGLLIGTGYPHSLASESSFKSGFFFDEISGLPVIPGSTLKGIVRSLFPDSKTSDSIKKAKTALIKKISGKDNLNIADFMKDCFENGDVFVGAYPVIEKGSSNILAADNITPHNGALKNPVPVSILKVKPNVKYRFIFILHEYTDGDITLTPNDKLNLFEQLLLINGAGAKTNVGFGKFSKNEYKIVKKADSSSSRQGNHGTGNSNAECGTVVDYNKTKTSAKVNLDNGKKADIYYKLVKGAEYGQIDKMLPLNTRVKVKYQGKQDNGFDKWDFLGIL